MEGDWVRLDALQKKDKEKRKPSVQVRLKVHFEARN
jgi:hypothetical protein